MTERSTDWAAPAMQARLRRRRASERRFRRLGLAAVLLSAAFLAVLLGTMVANGVGGFQRGYVRVNVDRTALPTPAAPPAAWRAAVADAAVRTLGPGGDALIADGAWTALRDAAPGAVVEVPVTSAARGPLRARGLLVTRLDPGFLLRSDATDAGMAGIRGALVGSLMTLGITLALAFPIGTLAAIYLEEYAPRTRATALIEVSINNLAAVPSIIFGLLGLAVFLGTFHLPRSAPIVGGLTLALMTMPVIVIAGRSAIAAVPRSVREAALGIGASRMQMVFHHVLPLALPGIATGTIIGMARALGETAPLLLIGMRAFIPASPGGPADPATVLPVQIFLWSDQVDAGFVERTSAAILVLLAVLMTMNAAAILLRDRFEARR